MNVEYMKMYRSDMNFTVTDLELLNHEDKMASEIINEGVIRPVITSRAIEKPAINDQSPRRMRKVVPRRELGDKRVHVHTLESRGRACAASSQTVEPFSPMAKDNWLHSFAHKES